MAGVELQRLLGPRRHRVEHVGCRRGLRRHHSDGRVEDLGGDHGAQRHGAEEAWGVIGAAEGDGAVEGVQPQLQQGRPHRLRVLGARGLDGFPQRVAHRRAVSDLITRGDPEARGIGLREILGAAEEAVVVWEFQAAVPLRRTEEAVAVLRTHGVNDPGVGRVRHEQGTRIHIEHVGVPDKVRHVVNVPAANVDIGLDSLDLENLSESAEESWAVRARSFSVVMGQPLPSTLTK